MRNKNKRNKKLLTVGVSDDLTLLFSAGTCTYSSLRSSYTTDNAAEQYSTTIGGQLWNPSKLIITPHKRTL